MPHLPFTPTRAVPPEPPEAVSQGNWGSEKEMAAPHRRTTVTVTEGAGAASAPGAPSTTLAQWLVNVNEDDEIRRYATGVALWRLIGDAERRAVVAQRLETALQLMQRAA
jgi:hypothetical protein